MTYSGAFLTAVSGDVAECPCVSFPTAALSSRLTEFAASFCGRMLFNAGQLTEDRTTQQLAALTVNDIRC